MGYETPTYTCPKCGQLMGAQQNGPNWTFMDVPGSLHGNPVILSCINGQCRAVLGVYYELVKMP